MSNRTKKKRRKVSLIVCDRLCLASFCAPTPEDAAAAAGRKEVVAFLLDAGFEIDRPNNLGETALHRAARRSISFPSFLFSPPSFAQP